MDHQQLNGVNSTELRFYAWKRQKKVENFQLEEFCDYLLVDLQLMFWAFFQSVTLKMSINLLCNAHMLTI